ncbi:MAG TPA: EthD family reductase [Candidatus Binataceae bacterium]|nr:EthD family reductase [Candidatus Binataceae bacterium]
MRTVFAALKFLSPNLQAEEENYLGLHVSLAKALPGLRSYITGKLIGSKNHPAPYYRAATLTFDDAPAMRSAMRDSPVAKPLVDDGAAHIELQRWVQVDTEIIVPLDAQPGASLMMMVAEFDLKLNDGDYAAAEDRYLNQHTHIARRLPGLRHYMIGGVVSKGGVQPQLPRMAFLVFDNAEAGRDAYRSPVGQELMRDEEATIANARVYRLDATVQTQLRV